MIVGIDPGKSGAVAVLQPGGSVVFLADAPVIRVGKRDEYDILRMADLLRGFGDESLLAIEQVGAGPHKGVIGAFSLGHGFGLWLGIAGAMRLRVERITPQRWKKAMLEGLSKEKGASLARARELFPKEAPHWLTRKKDDGRAEALLIAEYARRKLAVTT